jgi:predicted lipoprotein
MRKSTKALLERGAAVLVLAVLSSCTVVKLEKSGGSGGDQYSTWTKTGTGFQAAEYVAAIWDEKVLPAYEKQAADFVTVLEALRGKRREASERYGLKRETGEPFYVFKVRADARVVKYDDSSRNGLLRVNLEPSGKGMHAALQVGPVVLGTAIRDSLEFIRFTDVGNQLQFADLADQLNARMQKESVAPLDMSKIAGKCISFLGAFKLEEEQPIEDIVVTPVKISILDAGGNGK